jgi:hypothetical protein
MTAPSPDVEHHQKEMTMATKKKSTGKARVKINKLGKGKAKELTTKDAKRVRGGLNPDMSPPRFK